MKITLKKLLDDWRLTTPTKETWRAHAIWHTMCAYKPNANDWCDVFGIKPLDEDDADQVLDVRVTINGVEVPFESFLEHVSGQHARMINVGVRELFDERLRKLDNAVHRMNQLIRSELSSLGFSNEEDY